MMNRFEWKDRPVIYDKPNFDAFALALHLYRLVFPPAIAT
jgi:hypothetical protein